MLSISGCFIRGLWYFIFSVVVMGHEPVTSQSGFCQVTGFFIQLGNEISGKNISSYTAMAQEGKAIRIFTMAGRELLKSSWRIPEPPESRNRYVFQISGLEHDALAY